MTDKPDCEIICPDCKTLITIDKCGVLSEALNADREKVLETLHRLRNKLEEKEMSDVSLSQSKKFGAGRVAMEGAIKMIENVNNLEKAIEAGDFDE